MLSVSLLLLSGLVGAQELTSTSSQAQQPVSVQPAAEPATTKSRQATNLFQQGRAAMGRHSYAQACRLFAQSNHLDAKVGTMLNLAVCKEEQGKWLDALRIWKDAQLLAQRLGDDRKSVAQIHHDALTKRIPTLSLLIRPATKACHHVLVDGVSTGIRRGKLSVQVDPGIHVLTVQCGGHSDRRVSVTVQPGKEREVTVVPGPLLVPAKPTSSHSADSHHGPTTRADHQWAYLFGGIGAAGVTAAVVSGLMVLRRRGIVDAHCDTDGNCDREGAAAAREAQWMSIANAVAWGVGVGALGAGTYLYFRRSNTPSPADGKHNNATRQVFDGTMIGVGGQF